MQDIIAIAIATATLFIIIEPFSSIPIFIAITNRMTEFQRRKAAMTAVLFAWIILLPFIALGDLVFKVLGITTASFSIAGGILLFIIVVQMLFSEERENEKNIDSKLVLISVPLIAGPGAISATLLMTSRFGFLPTFISVTLAMIATSAVFLLASWFKKKIGERGLMLIGKILLILVGAVAVQFVVDGLVEVVKTKILAG